MQQFPAEGVISAVSRASAAELAALELASQLLHPHLGFVLFFCSAEYDLPALGQALQQRLGPLLLTIGCDCFLRRLELESRDSLAEVGSFLRSQRVLGFNSYGEQFNGMHINQTFTGVAIARNRAALSR